MRNLLGIYKSSDQSGLLPFILVFYLPIFEPYVYPFPAKICDGFAFVNALARGTKMVNSQAGICTDGTHSQSEALLLNTCQAPVPSKWRQGLNVRYLKFSLLVSIFELYYNRTHLSDMKMLKEQRTLINRFYQLQFEKIISF